MKYKYTTKPSDKLGLCAFPNCSGFNKGSKYNLCRKHEDMMLFFTWMLDKMVVDVPTEEKPKEQL